MMIIDLLKLIPPGIAALLALIGLVPFFMILKKPPQGIIKSSVYVLVYIVGGIGFMSFVIQTLLTGT